MSKILIACEESGIVTKAFRDKGHEAFSCDVLETSGSFPEYHLQQDLIPLLGEKWDMIVAFPPCTHLAASGARWFSQKRQDGRQQQAVKFFMAIANCSCPKICIENPVGIMSTIWRKPDQILQPWQFGHGETKATCLWLKNLPILAPTNVVKGRSDRIHKMPQSKERAMKRSKTYPGIAAAMADQWS